MKHVVLGELQISYYPWIRQWCMEPFVLGVLGISYYSRTRHWCIEFGALAVLKVPYCSNSFYRMAVGIPRHCVSVEAAVLSCGDRDIH